MDVPMKHTPGPWIALTSSAHAETDFAIGNRQEDFAIGKKTSRLATGAGNAALIAAAPELLEALQGLRDSFVVAVGDKSPFAKLALGAANAAISLARGTPHD